MQDLFGGASTGFPQATDPCSDRGPVAERTQALRDFCIASGVPAAAVFTRAVQPNAQIQADFGGNPDVGEETSDTYTAGVVIQPAFVPRLNIAVDYFNITVEDTINTRLGGLGSALSLCFNTVRNLQDPACTIFAGKRNTGTGALGLNSGGLNPSLVQDNVGKLETAGVDVQIDYSVPLFKGDLSFMFLATWLDKYRNTPVALLPLRAWATL